MKLKATDTLHVSAVGPDNITPGSEFEASDDTGRQLVERGLATEIKEAVAPGNEMGAEPMNKSVAKRKVK